MTNDQPWNLQHRLVKTGPRIKAVLFDFDGTLTLPGSLDFPAIKAAIDCPREMAILEYIETISEETDRQAVNRILDQAEEEAARQSQPNEGAEELLSWLKDSDIKVGIITRNALAPVVSALKNFSHTSPDDFDVIISRETPVQPKPSPEAVNLALQQLQVESSEALMVGDYLFDITAGNSAGVSTILIPALGEQRDVTGWGQDLQITSLSEMREIVSCRLPLQGGKLPNRFLDGFLANLDTEDPSILIAPGVGEDTTAIDIVNEEVLILKSDPITFVSESAARYAVTINANDIATSGATPRWFLSTLLFPTGSTPWEILSDMSELQMFCQQQRITLCGGHTEITDAVTRPIISGMIAGTVTRDRLIDKRNMKSGDCILLTKAVSVEGTAILAQEFSEQLRAGGLTDIEISEGAELLEQISVVPEAGISASFTGVTAMHDVTEGGLATALEEFSRAGGQRLRVDKDRIPIMELTRRMCRILNLDPLGLIGSGSLLIACRQSSLTDLIVALEQAGVEVAHIGEAVEPGVGLEARISGKPCDWPVFEADELARLYG